MAADLPDLIPRGDRDPFRRRPRGHRDDLDDRSALEHRDSRIRDVGRSRAALPGVEVLLRQVGAMGVEPTHQSIVRPAYQLVGVHRIDVVIDHVGQHLAEQEHLPKGPFAGARLQRGPAPEEEKHHRQRTTEEQDTAAAHGHLGA